MRRLGLALSFALACASAPSPHPLPAGVTYAGRWDSNFHEMRLQQQGKKVFGTVAYRDGSISGEADGDILHFKWYQKENRQHGKGWLRMLPGGQRMEGRWGYEDSEDDGGVWWADRYEGSDAPEETPASESFKPGESSN